MMSQFLISWAAVLLLHLQVLVSGAEFEYDHVHVLKEEEDLQPDLCMLQLGANARRHDHAQAKNLLHHNCTGRGSADSQPPTKQHSKASKLEKKPVELKSAPREVHRLNEQTPEEA